MKIKFLKSCLPICYFALIFLTVASCKKDEVVVDPTPPVQAEIAYNVPGFDEPIHPIIQTSIGGVVTDQNNNAIAGAVVKLEGNTQTTDVNGVFHFKDVNVKERAYLTTEVAGYFLGSKAIWTLANSSNFTELQLIPETIIGNFMESTGGIVTMSNNTSVNFPAGAIVKADGSTYAGQVDVAMAYLDPEDAELPNYMPGNLDATATDGSNVILETFGMLAVELKGSAGEPLQLKKGSTAEITVPLSATVLADATSEIPLWFFDEQWGYWREEGKATLQGNSYVGKVSHFSFWNCDAKVPLVQLKGTIKDNAGNSLSGYKVVLKRTIASTRPAGYGTTDNNGCFSGSIPANETFIIEVEDNCGNVIYSATVGPFATNVTLPTITITPPLGYTTVSGTLLNCAGTPVTNGYAKITAGTKVVYALVDAMGNFTVSFNACSATTFDIIGYDLTNVKESAQTNHTIAPTVSLGNISVCNTITHFLTYSLDGGSNITLIDFTSAARIMDSLTSSYHTVIEANNSSPSASLYMIIGGDVVGTFPLVNNISGYDGTSQFSGSATGVNGTFTSYAGAIGGDVTGSFSGSFVDSGGMTRTISGSFNLLRTN